MQALPKFDLADYRQLLRGLRSSGYALLPVSAMSHRADERVAYLRHDLDFSPLWALPMARAEAELGVAATYYVLLTGPYNPLAPRVRAALHELIDLGAELGLHYDLTTYPTDPEQAAAHFARERDTLSNWVGVDIQTATSHQPSLSGTDLFREGGPCLHPHDPRWAEGLLYVSDSCRAWRDETLLSVFGPTPPQRLLLLTHPELWLDGSIESRHHYLHRRVEAAAAATAREYFASEVATIWHEHSGARAHDERTARPTWTALDRVQARQESAALLSFLESAYPQLGWTEEQLLADRPLKWEVSAQARASNGALVALAICSVQEEALYVHVLATHPDACRRGIAREGVLRLRSAALRRGLRRVELRVALDNRSALQFYAAMGFALKDVETADSAQTQARLVLAVDR